MRNTFQMYQLYIDYRHVQVNKNCVPPKFERLRRNLGNTIERPAGGFASKRKQVMRSLKCIWPNEVTLQVSLFTQSETKSKLRL